MAIPDKYKGKSFADIANKIQEKYKDRYDAVSIRGLNKEVNDLQSAQEYERAKMKMQEQIEAQQQQQIQQQAQGQPEQQIQTPQQGANNQGIGFNPTQEQSTFKREASSDYNEKFAYGGKMTNDYAQGATLSTVNRMDGTGQFGIQTPDINVQGVQLPNQSGFNFNSKAQMGVGLGLQTAPLVSNLIQGLTMKPADNVPVRTVSNQGLSGLRNFRARESRFEDIDLDNIERGITEASGRFTQNNISASRGNAGAFVANELGNQSNLYRAIGDARMKAQIADRETDQLNASERARVDALNLQKESQVASMQSRNDIFNAQMQAQADVQNQQNDAAYQSFKSDLLNTGASSIANIGSTLLGAGQMGEITGYDIFGNFLGGTNESKYGGISKSIKSLRNNQYADGGELNGDPTKKKKVIKDDEEALKIRTEYSGGTGTDRDFNPNYIYDEPNEEGVGVVTRLKPAYNFTGDDAEAQRARVIEEGGDKYEKYRTDFIKQLGKGKVDKSKYIVNDNNEVILKDGYIMLGQIDKAQYKKDEDDEGTIIRYRNLPKEQNKKAYGGLSTIKKLRKKK